MYRIYIYIHTVEKKETVKFYCYVRSLHTLFLSYFVILEKTFLYVIF